MMNNYRAVTEVAELVPFLIELCSAAAAEPGEKRLVEVVVNVVVELVVQLTQTPVVGVAAAEWLPGSLATGQVLVP